MWFAAFLISIKIMAMEYTSPVAQAESMRNDSQFFSFEEALEAALNICGFSIARKNSYINQ
jgi:hypothetical protein